MPVILSVTIANGPLGTRPHANNAGGTPVVELGVSRIAQSTNRKCLCQDFGLSDATLFIKVFNWCWNDRSVDAETTVSGSDDGRNN